MTDVSVLPAEPEVIKPRFSGKPNSSLASIQHDIRKCARELLEHKQRLDTLCAQINSQANEILRACGD